MSFIKMKRVFKNSFSIDSTNQIDLEFLYTFLNTDIRSDSSYIKKDFLRDNPRYNFSTNICYIQVENEAVTIRELYDDRDLDAPGLKIKKDQLLYLMDEWARLVREKANEITIYHDEVNDTYTIEGK